MNNKKNNIVRSRNFATVLYLDSCVENWLDILNSLHIPIAVSPYHDRDYNADGEQKKPHYHIQFIFDGNKSIEQVEEITKIIGSVGVEVLSSKRGYLRYLCHLDNPEKAQYKTSDVITFGGLDYLEEITSTVDRYLIISEMLEFIENNNVLSYRYILMYSKNNRPDWFRSLCDNSSYVIKEFLKSKEWERNNPIPQPTETI